MNRQKTKPMVKRTAILGGDRCACFDATSMVGGGMYRELSPIVVFCDKRLHARLAGCRVKRDRRRQRQTDRQTEKKEESRPLWGQLHDDESW